MKRRLAAVAALLALALACGRVGVPQPPPDPRTVKPPSPPPPPWQLAPASALTPSRRELVRALEDARRRWYAAAPRAYRLIVSRECFCDPGLPFESEVEGVVVITAAGGVTRRGHRLEAELHTVEGLFTEAERLARSNADEVVLVFDHRFGYPAVMAVDRWREGSDDEWTWRASLSVLE